MPGAELGIMLKQGAPLHMFVQTVWEETVSGLHASLYTEVSRPGLLPSLAIMTLLISDRTCGSFSTARVSFKTLSC